MRLERDVRKRKPSTKADYFVTLNKNLIKRRNQLESKFKLKIVSAEELEKIADKKTNL